MSALLGDVVAIVAARDEQAADKALKNASKVQYQVLEPVLDFRTAKDNPIGCTRRKTGSSLCPVGVDNKRNLCALLLVRQRRHRSGAGGL